MLDEWETEHKKMLHWTKKIKITGASGERNLFTAKEKDTKNKVAKVSQKDEDRELPWTPPNRWETWLDKNAGAGYIYADICVGTDATLKSLLDSWCTENEASNAFARIWKETCLTS